MDVFDQHRNNLIRSHAPLADRMRPRTLDEFAGQEHIIGPGRLLRRAIQIDQLSSLIFYGPPGTGKTTLARIIAKTTRAQFISINAVLAGVKDIRDAIESARQTLSLYSRRTILFVDEVHRFNKSQQDALLPHVENGVIILIGATTENPYFEVNKALVSRSRIFQLKSLDDDGLRRIARMALEDNDRGYGAQDVTIDEDALDHLVATANGDARSVLNALELAVETTAPDAGEAVHITRSVAEESIQQRAVLYDKDGDAHYDTISAFIKSVRGSDPDAALYWMGKMIYAGEDSRFIFRRMLVLASEDIGLADPQALGVVISAAQAFDYVGMPEGRFHLAQACLYLATAPKSNSTMAFFDALAAAEKDSSSDEVPNHLRDANRDKEGFGHGEGYLYPHAYRDHWVAQQYLPGALQGRLFYQPSDQGYEKGVKARISRFREAMLESMIAGEPEPFGAAVDSGDVNAAWISRTVSQDWLAHVRERIFELADVQRDSLTLDLHGRTGFLGMEAARRSPDGSVWICARSRKQLDAQQQLAAAFDGLSRPQLIIAKLKEAAEKIQSAAGAPVQFDRIVGRNVIAGSPDKQDDLSHAASLLNSTGTGVLAETVWSRSQRLSELLQFPANYRDLEEVFRKGESALFDDPENPLMQWDVDYIRKLGVPGISLAGKQEVIHPLRRFSESVVRSWFGADENAFSLHTYLSRFLSAEEMHRLSTMVVNQLAGRDVRWRMVIGYICISKI
ncbi:MAG: AAA family ATPase [Chitinivibrionales bacterium]|nr:AAA family ATPase [Chitinivibrionales bacterium]